MVVVDTNVLVHLLIDGDRTAEARRLHALDADWHSEAFALVEFANVLATAMRVRGLPARSAETLLGTAQDLILPRSHSVPHLTALEFAHRHTVSAYDARFLAVASELGLLLVTEDTRLRAAAPGLTQSLAGAIAAA